MVQCLPPSGGRYNGSRHTDCPDRCDGSGGRPAAEHKGLFQRIQDKLSSGDADTAQPMIDISGVDIHNEGDIGKPLPGRDIGEV